MVFTPVWQTEGMWEDGHLKIDPVEVTNEGDAECGWLPATHSAYVSAGPEYGSTLRMPRQSATKRRTWSAT